MSISSVVFDNWPTALSAHIHGKWLCAGIVLCIYLLTVRCWRYRRVRALEREFAELSGNITPAQAQRFMIMPSTLDFPWIYEQSQALALFKTFAIPSISHLLHKTKQISKKENSSKRHVDTAVLMASMITCPLSGPGSGVTIFGNSGEVDPRGAIAMARMNWIHSHYPSIRNEEYLYGLSVFICEPIKWSQKFEWRALSHAEVQALYVFWTEIGRRMGITGIPSSLEEFREWADAYERDNMVPDEINAVVAEETIRLVLHNVPTVLQSFGRKVIACLLEDRVRIAMLLPAPSPLLQQFIFSLLHLRAFFIRNLCLPRFKPRYFVDPNLTISKVKGNPGLPRMHPSYYASDPWYYPESTGLQKLLEKVQIKIGLTRAEDVPGPHFQSEGYRLEEIGPKAFAKLDHGKIIKMAEEIQGSPVTGPFSLNYAGGCPMHE